MRDYGKWAVGISFFIHTIIIAGLPSTVFLKPPKISENKIVNEITLITKTAEEIKVTEKRKADKFKEPPPYIKNPPPYVDNLKEKLMPQNDRGVSFVKQLNSDKSAKKVTLDTIESDKDLMKIPAYMDYYNDVRNRIRKYAYRLYNDTDNEGEIFLFCSVLPDGSLAELSLKRNSTDSETLRQIAIVSVKKSAPFPAFPKELKHLSNLPFNVIIQFIKSAK